MISKMWPSTKTRGTGSPRAQVGEVLLPKLPVPILKLCNEESPTPRVALVHGPCTVSPLYSRSRRIDGLLGLLPVSWLSSSPFLANIFTFLLSSTARIRNAQAQELETGLPWVP